MGRNHKKEVWSVDIRKVLAEKNPKLYRWIPSFVLYLFEKLLCLEKVNQVIKNNEGKRGVEYARNLVKESEVISSIKYKQVLDPNKRYIFVCNHPLGGLDALTFASLLDEKTSNFKFMVNDILMNLKGLEDLFLPINKHGAQARENTRLINEAYESNIQMIVFPAGLVSRKQKGGIKDLVWHKNFVNKAIQFERDVVPVHIIAKNSSFFYNFAMWRKRLGVKINLEMLLLPREFFNFHGKRLDIVVGEPVRYEVLKEKHSREEWAKKLKEIVYSLQ